MKKIGIITYHKSINYGAQLQAYALRKILQNLGCDSEVIDCNNIGDGKIFNWSFLSMKCFLGSLRNNLLSLISEKKRRKLFSEFSRNVIGVSKFHYNKQDLNNIIKEYDFVITGSDQVWHPQICEGNTLFFLDLPIKDEKKIAYAPSFGKEDYTQEEANKYIPFIKKIKYLSVREQAGQKIIQKYLGIKVPIVLDPTMLLDSQEWSELIKENKYSKYLFYFTILDEPYGADDMVKKIAKEKGLKIVRIGSIKDILKIGFINARANGPLEFLGLVKNADFIVTSSFHGSVFSILFEKQFLCVLNNNDRNSRMETLLHRLSLDYLLVKDTYKYNFKEDYKAIDYSTVNLVLQKLRQESIDFLKRAIGL